MCYGRDVVAIPVTLPAYRDSHRPEWARDLIEDLSTNVDGRSYLGGVMVLLLKLRLMPTGRVGSGNLAEFDCAGAVGRDGALVTREAAREGNFGPVTNNVCGLMWAVHERQAWWSPLLRPCRAGWVMVARLSRSG